MTRRSPRGRLPAALLILLLFGAILPPLGCSKEKGRPAPPPAPVLVADAVSMDVPVGMKEIGTVEAYNTVGITARVGGQLVRVGFAEGQDVKQGDFLFQIDPAPYQAALAQAQGDLDRDRARLTNAQADVTRYKDLVSKEYVTKQQYEASISDAAAAKATVEGDSAAVQTARLNLDYCLIRSPLAGRTGNLLVHQGNLVSANGANPLVTINQIVPVYVSFTISAQQLSDVRRYLREGSLAVTATLPPDSTDVYEGKLTFFNNAVDEATGTILMKATFPNEDRALWPGQFVQVNLVLTKEVGATVVPASAIQTSQQGDFIYVIKSDGTAEMRPVAQGTRLDDEVVIEKGVQPGEKVVTDGQLRLIPGAKVTVKTNEKPTAPGQGSAQNGNH